MLFFLSHWLILAQLYGGATKVLLQQTTPTSQPAGDSQPAAVATTQPTLVIVQDPGRGLSVFEKTRLMRLAEGKDTVTFREMLNPEFWLETIRDLIKAVILFIPSLLGALLFLFIFWLIYRACRRLMVGAMNRANLDTSIRDMMVTLTKWTIMGFGLVIACNTIGIPIVAMLTGVSILGLAVGFAAQETLANFIAGVVIFWDKPFKAGDWLTVDGTFGQMQRITFRSSRLLNLDGEIIIFPNTYMLANRVANHTAHPLSRINIPIGIAYEESIDAARAALLKTVDGDSRIRSSPPAEVVVDKCADSSVNLLLRFWITDESLERKMMFEYNEKSKKALDAAKIEIPYPHVQVVTEMKPEENKSGAAQVARG